MHTADVIVIGCGIAGASAAAELSGHANVIVLEAEDQPGFHATSRSAAYFAAAYGKPGMRGLTVCSESFFTDPSNEFAEVALIHPRDNMFFGRADQQASMQAMLQHEPSLELIDAAAVMSRVPIFKPDYLHGAVWDRRGGDLDVDAILQAYLKRLRRRGGQLLREHRVESLDHTNGAWIVRAAGQEFEAAVVINAAGAWADHVAGLAGLASLGIQPLRRTALTIDAPQDVEVGDWPNMMDVDEDFYFKPEAGKILISPADESPTTPCDAQPDDLDVAIGVDRFEQATGLDIRHVEHSWAGLRTFAPDRDLVVGFDPRADGFFWLAGQGGSGIGCAPATAALVSHLVMAASLPDDFATALQFIDDVKPDRLI